MFDEKEAMRRASLAVILSRPSNMFTCLSSYFLGTKPVQPLRVTAAYLPGWIIDADVQTKLWLGYKEGGKWVLVLRMRRTRGCSDAPLSTQSSHGLGTRMSAEFLLRDSNGHTFLDICQVNVSTRSLLYCPHVLTALDRSDRLRSQPAIAHVVQGF